LRKNNVLVRFEINEARPQTPNKDREKTNRTDINFTEGGEKKKKEKKKKKKEKRKKKRKKKKKKKKKKIKRRKRIGHKGQ